MERNSTKENTESSSGKIILGQALLGAAFVVMVVVFVIALLSRFAQ